MDKNTINGLLAMLAVFILFMWLSPKNNTENERSAQEEQTIQGTPVATTLDSLTQQESEWLRSNIIENGVPETLADSTRAYRLEQGPVNLTLAGDSVWGTVEVEGEKLAWGDLNSPAAATKIGIKRQRKAIDIVRQASISLGKYGRFSRFLTGTDSKVRLENDVLSLDLSARSGSITRAELKKYRRNRQDKEKSGDFRRR